MRRRRAGRHGGGMPGGSDASETCVFGCRAAGNPQAMTQEFDGGRPRRADYRGRARAAKRGLAARRAGNSQRRGRSRHLGANPRGSEAARLVQRVTGPAMRRWLASMLSIRAANASDTAETRSGGAAVGTGGVFSTYSWSFVAQPASMTITGNTHHIRMFIRSTPRNVTRTLRRDATRRALLLEQNNTPWKRSEVTITRGR